MDAIFVAAGSGSTAAGLLAGACVSSLASMRVVAVQVSDTPFLRGLIIAQARAALKRLGVRVGVAELNRRLDVDKSWIGAGYGHPTAAGDCSTEAAAQWGLELEGTYTAKTLAAALRSIGRLPNHPLPAVRRYRHAAYWHTLSHRAARELIPHGVPVPGRLAQLFTLS